MRTFGKAVAIQVSGEGAVEDVDHARHVAGEKLNRHFIRVLDLAAHDGYELDIDTFNESEAEEGDRIILTWTVQGRQTRSLWTRLVRAWRMR